MGRRKEEGGGLGVNQAQTLFDALQAGIGFGLLAFKAKEVTAKLVQVVPYTDKPLPYVAQIFAQMPHFRTEGAKVFKHKVVDFGCHGSNLTQP